MDGFGGRHHARRVLPRLFKTVELKQGARLNAATEQLITPVAVLAQERQLRLDERKRLGVAALVLAHRRELQARPGFGAACAAVLRQPNRLVDLGCRPVGVGPLDEAQRNRPGRLRRSIEPRA